MTVVKINAITVAPERREEFARRFHTPAGEEPDADGFEGSELLIADDDHDICLVVTRWRSHGDFIAWTQSDDFAIRHARHSAGGPVGTSSDIWSFAVAR